MCGIIGYTGYRQASWIAYEALLRLEYRGYDSVGMAVAGEEAIEVRKDIGKVAEVNDLVHFKEMKGTTGIGHTRWATHGGVTKTNAHPHISNNQEIVVIHNGIVENYQELKQLLEKEGFSFYSETDTEIIPNLIEYEMSKGKSFQQATMDTVKQLKGYYAVLTMHLGEKKIIGTRNGSPLVVGVGEGENFIASDIPAFLEYTKQVQYIHDNDFVVLDGETNKVSFYSTETGEPVTRPTHRIDWDLEQAEKGAFDHFMMKEITEQVETVKAAINQDKETLLHVAELVNNARGVFLVACGSSYHACLTASYLFSKIAKMHVNVVLGSEFSNYEHFLTEETLVIFVSQSGETIDVLDALRTARRRNSKAVSIVNVVGSSLYRNSDHNLLLNAGPEICVLSTKTYTAQLTVLSLLIYTVAGLYDQGKHELSNLWNMIYMLTSANTRSYIQKLSELLQSKDHIFLIGRGLQYPTALEAALKIKEVSYIHAEGFSGGELKHGTIALIEKGTPCIVFSSVDTEHEIISNAMEIKARGGYIIGVNHKNNEVFDFFIKVPDVGDLNPVIQIIPIQILSYQLALLRGADPDKPRNLAKSVTVK
ncbi:glutamine--fructose-6-phosphate transaminase (isomerizing) [Candidatus Bathyarchaeota archaeon]|jgi:glucosamine--fructose-6-phosphate aminotransferase (isomerizing)|nr:MAG: glutamine--fructose-6-phosphate transaminase (isomerizing) [Candidatus Bathyarchaeota archaeon]